MVPVMATVMYVKPNCPYCASARDHLSATGEPFEERDATADRAWRSELMEHSRGSGVVPTIVRDGGEVQVGFPPGRG
jgi:glutaredoxin